METRVKVILILIGGYLMVLSIKDQFFDYYRQQEDFDGYSEPSNKHAANLILFEKIFLPTFLIRTYTFIYFWGKFQPTHLLEPTCLLNLGGIPIYKIILSSFKLLFCCLMHFQVASKS